MLAMKLADIEKLAVEIAELAKREAVLSDESARILDELNAVRAAKAEKLQRLASGSNGSSPGTPAKTLQGGLADAKERVYGVVVAAPTRVFTTSDVSSELGLKRNTTSVYLSELAKEGRITRLAAGKYRARPSGNANDVGSTVTATSSTVQDGAWPAKIASLLASAPQRIFSAPDIARHFKVSDEASINTIRGTLSRLQRGGKITKTGHGGYRGAPREVPGRNE